MFGLIAELVKIPLTGVVNYFKGKQEIKKASNENRARLLRDEESNNAAWEMSQLEKSDEWLRRLSFGILSFPIVMAWFDPEQVKVFFEVAMAAIPQWYQIMYVSIIGAIWGFAEWKGLRK